MTTVTILPENTDTYRALAGGKESTGRTAGEALDALTAQLSDDESGTLVIVQNYKADEFFNAAQQRRLAELMQLRQSGTLPLDEERELEGLVEAELDGARLRAERHLEQRLRADDDVSQPLRAAEVAQRQRHELGGMLPGLSSYEVKLLTLSFIDDLSPQEIATVLNEDADNIRYRLLRITAKILHRVRTSLPQEEKRSEGQPVRVPQSDEG